MADKVLPHYFFLSTLPGMKVRLINRLKKQR
jgi:hypothetical protein